jgi:hypothetical protein
MASIAVDFDPVEHRYFVTENGGRRELPSVSFLLEEHSGGPNRFFKPWHAQRGSMVHRATALDDQGILDESTLDDRIAGYLSAWRKFRGTMNLSFTDIEYIVADLALGYAGTADRRAFCPSRSRPIVLDIKSGSASPLHRLQCAAYVRADPDWESLDGMVVYLRQDGKFSLQVYEGIPLLGAIHDFEDIVRKHYQGGSNLFGEGSL